MVKVIFDKVLGVVREDKFSEYLSTDGFAYDLNFDLDTMYTIIYIGREDLDGSWRIIQLGGKYTVQNRVDGSWTTVSNYDSDGLHVVKAVEAHSGRDLLRYSFMLGN